MERFRRGNYVFIAWKGDHSPRHVHVFHGRRLVVKWDLENERAMVGFPSARLRRLLDALRREGRL
jgi:hypothetical protein